MNKLINLLDEDFSADVVSNTLDVIHELLT